MNPVEVPMEQLLIPIGERPYGKMDSRNKETIILTALTNVVAMRLKHLLDDKLTRNTGYTEDEWLRMCLNFAAQDISNIIQALKEAKWPSESKKLIGQENSSMSFEK
ncbi:uncharacterized protein [Watersipora subatra]|uniref:uncharacterized protein n=1 Tax=Watersipora subatra TaxID=2589382 RepID=UPI00355B8BEB